MAAIVWSDVLSHAPELSTLPVEAQDDLLATVLEWFDEREYGGEESYLLRMARIWWCAHFATLTLRRGASVGPMTSSTAGRLTRTYAVINQTTAGGYGSTPYGAMLDALNAGTPSPIGMAM